MCDFKEYMFDYINYKFSPLNNIILSKKFFLYSMKCLLTQMDQMELIKINICVCDCMKYKDEYMKYTFHSMSNIVVDLYV